MQESTPFDIKNFDMKTILWIIFPQFIFNKLQEASAVVNSASFKQSESLPLVGQLKTLSGSFSSIECSLKCVQNDGCFTTELDQAGNACKLVLYQDSTFINGFGTGRRFQRQRVCRYDGYQYFEEMDVCLRFGIGLTWYKAKLLCEEGGGELFSSENANKDLFIRGPVLAEYARTRQKQWWLGGNDIEMEGSFKWLNGNSFSFTNWIPTEPNDSTNFPNGGMSFGADCVVYNAMRLKWSDRTCNDLQGAICESREFI